MGLLVDTVPEVLRIPVKQIDTLPAVMKGESSRFLQGLEKAGDNGAILLDYDRLFHNEAIKRIGNRVKDISKNTTYRKGILRCSGFTT